MPQWLIKLLEGIVTNPAVGDLAKAIILAMWDKLLERIFTSPPDKTDAIIGSLVKHFRKP